MQSLPLSSLRLFGVLAVTVCALLTTPARADYTDLSLTHEKNIQSYVVNPDGSFVLDVERVINYLGASYDEYVKFIGQPLG